MKKKLLIISVMLSLLICIDVKALTFTPDKVDTSTYIVGTHMFSSEGSDKYNGIFTTEWIMYASKTIQSDNLKDMIIYRKNAHGNWVNAISGNDITPPQKFEIEFIDEMPVSDLDIKPVISIDGEPAPLMKIIGYNKDDYCALGDGSSCQKYSIDGIEIYEKVGENQYQKLDLPGESDSVLASPLFNIPNVQKTIVARVYVKIGDRFEYSDYSNELVVDTRIPKPGIGEGASDFLNKEIGIVGYGDNGSFCIEECGAGEFHISGYEVYEKNGNNYTKLTTITELSPYVARMLPNEEKTFAIRVFVTSNGTTYYSDYSEMSFDTIVAKPTLAQDMTGPDGDHLVPEYNVGEGGKVCTNLHINNASEIATQVDGFTVYDANNNTAVYTSSTIDSHVTLCETSETTKTYYAKTYIEGSDNNKIESEKSNNVIINFTMEVMAPTLYQDTTGPDGDHQVLEYFFDDGGKVCTDLHINSDDLTNKVDGFIVYNANDNTVVSTQSDLSTHVTLCENSGTTKTYYAKTYKEGPDHSKIYSEKSNNVTVNFTMEVIAPTLAQDMTGPDGDHLVPEYNVGEEGKVCTNLYIDVSEVAGLVDGFIIYNAEGDAEVATPARLDSHVTLCENQGTTKTYYAKTYKEGPDHSKIYSDKSNNVTITFNMD